MTTELFKYECFLSIFSNKPYTLSSAKVVSASTLSRFLSRSDFNPLPLISDSLRKILSTINHHTAFPIADTSLLKKSGRNFQYISNISLHIIDNLTIPIHLKLLFDKKPITCNRFINFLSDRDITFVRAVSQKRVDE